MTNHHTTASIVLTDRDNERLSALAAGHKGQASEAGRTLARELEGARIVRSKKVSPDIVTMNSRVMVRDEVTGKTRVFTLVYPGDENVMIGNLSILTPAGAASSGCARARLRHGSPATVIPRN